MGYVKHQYKVEGDNSIELTHSRERSILFKTSSERSGWTLLPPSKNLNLRESAAVIYLIEVKSRKYAWSSDSFSVINGYSFHKMTIITPHSTRAACYTILLTLNTKRPAFFLVSGHSETHLLESSAMLETSYSSITNCVSGCIFPNYRQ